MRHLLALLLLLAPGTARDPTALDVLAGLLDDDGTRPAAAARIEALGVEGIPLLDQLRTRVRSEKGLSTVVGALEARGREIRKRLLAGERDWFGKEVAPRLEQVSKDGLWPLRAGLGPEREPVLFFDAKTFEDPERLRVLEYLVCPEPPRKGQGSKGYECLAGMAEAEWEAFGRAFAGGRPLRLRFVVWALVTIDLERALPWAVPVLHEHGMSIGNNRDERENRSLPGHGQGIQVGVVIR